MSEDFLTLKHQSTESLKERTLVTTIWFDVASDEGTEIQTAGNYKL